MTLEEDRAFVQMAIEFLEVRGYTITLGKVYREFISCVDFAKLLPVKLGNNGLSRRLKHSDCPAYEAELGESGRIIRILPNPAVIKFCSQPITTGRRMKPVTLLEPVRDFHHDNGS